LSSSVWVSNPITFKLVFRDLAGRKYIQVFYMTLTLPDGEQTYIGSCSATVAPDLKVSWNLY
jgi:hypothetical protein